MTDWLWCFLLIIICQRLAELLLAKRNEKWMKNRGAYEVGKDHYKWFVIVHSLFFVSIILESILTNYQQPLLIPLFMVFILTQLLRIWCMVSLGRYWNTKVIVLPGENLIRLGPYRYIKHPNYLIVGIEFIIIPLLFGAYITLIIFPVLHIMLLRIRIPIEEKALLELNS